VSAADGAPLWHSDIDEDTMYTAELLIENRLISHGARGVAAIDVRTGAVLWKTNLRDTPDQSVLTCVATAQEVVVLYEDGWVYTLNLTDGATVSRLVINNAEQLIATGSLVFVTARVEGNRGQLIAIKRGALL
jgi:outer membrane protein assembly factor BamB